MTTPADPTADPPAYTVWFDYGSEGWHPVDCNTLDELLAEIAGRGYTADYRVTRPVKVSLVVTELDR